MSRRAKKRKSSNAQVALGSSPGQAWKPLRILSKIIGATITLLVTLSGVLAYWPLVAIDVGPSLDSDNPFSYPFIISNDGILPLFGVSVSCIFDKGKFEGGVLFENNRMVFENKLQIMAPHQKTTAPCHRMFGLKGMTLISASTTIAVSFYPALWPSRTSVSRSFRAELTDGKGIVWLPE